MDSRADSEQHRKLFIGGLSYKTTKETLHEYYEKWGELVDSVVMQDKLTAKSRGFGFVTFRNSDALEKAMSERPHEIDGKRVDPKRAIPKEMGKDSGKMDAYMSVKKIFVGGIRDKPVTEEDLKTYFAQFGNIKDSVIMTDRETKKSRGFAFVVFDDYDSVDKIVIQRFHIINGVNVEVKKAIPKEETLAIQSRPVVFHSSRMMGSGPMQPYAGAGYQGYGGWGSGAYAGAPMMTSNPPNIYGYTGGYAAAPTPYGGYNPRDLPTYGGDFGSFTQTYANGPVRPTNVIPAVSHANVTQSMSNPRVGNLGMPNPYPGTTMTSGVSYSGAGFGSNVYIKEERR